ncbi:MAG TPA: type I methionyl aminopeptidase [Bacillota bacterium]|jgi:methionyl aminopeptidase
MIIIKSPEELAIMREAGRIVARTRRILSEAVKPGVTTGELDTLAEDVIRKAGATPTFKGYHGFPASICASVDAEVVHGFPGPRRLIEGEIISIDLGATYRGYVGDAAITLPVGEILPEVAALLEATKGGLAAGIAQATGGNHLSDISHAVQAYVESRGFSVVRDFVGHGIGQNMHEDPQVPNFGPPGRGPLLKEGMTLALEPMVNLGTHAVYIEPNGWTVRTLDGKPSAHFEETVAITADGPVILTAE